MQSYLMLCRDIEYDMLLVRVVYGGPLTKCFGGSNVFFTSCKK